jgi:hypothetical protein
VRCCSSHRDFELSRFGGFSLGCLSVPLAAETGFRCPYSPRIREGLSPETGLSALGVLRNQLPAYSILGNSGHTGHKKSRGYSRPSIEFPRRRDPLVELVLRCGRHYLEGARFSLLTHIKQLLECLLGPGV